MNLQLTNRYLLGAAFCPLRAEWCTVLPAIHDLNPFVFGPICLNPQLISLKAQLQTLAGSVARFLVNGAKIIIIEIMKKNTNHEGKFEIYK